MKMKENPCEKPSVRPTCQELTINLKERKIIHAKKRFLKRFNYKLSDSEYLEIAQIVKQGRAELVEWEKGGCGVYKLSWNKFKFYAVYGHDLDCIISFLTLSMIPK